MSLEALPQDVLAQIVNFTDGRYVMHLLMAGCRCLNAKIVAEPIKVTVGIDRFCRFPSSLLSLPRLTSLSVMVNLSSTYPFRLNGLPMLPQGPRWPGLKTLQINSPQALQLLEPIPSQCPLSECMPNLEQLTLTGSRGTFTEVHAKALPRRLLRFSASATSKPAPLTILAHLPRTLESLTSCYWVVQPDPVTGSYQGIDWPPNLKRLFGMYMSTAILLALPPLLEDFFATITPSAVGPTTVQVPSVRLSQLPRTIKKFGVYGGNPTYVELDAPFPPNLQSWSMDYRTPDGRTLEPHEWPASLTTFDDKNLTFSPATVARLPAGLTSLYLSSSALAGTYTSWPRSLRNLRIDTHSPIVTPTAFLPRGLLSFVGAVNTTEEMKSLPSRLTSLSLVPSTAQRLLPETLQALPSKVSNFDLTFAHLGSSENLLAIPPTVTILSLRVGDSTQAAGREVAECTDLGSLMPSQLVRLSITIVGTSCNYQHWLAELDHLKSLTSLSVTLHRTLPLVGEVDFVARLPRSLTQLHIPSDASWASNYRILADLPPRLISLRLDSSIHSTNHFSDRHFEFLPKGLYSLYIGDVAGLTPHFWSVIPPGILYVIISYHNTTAQWKEAKKAYYSTPLWQKLPPSV